VPNCLVCVVDDDLDHPPSPVKYILGHADNVALELILCPNQPISDAEFLVCIWVRHDLREHGVLAVLFSQDLWEIHAAFNLGSQGCAITAGCSDATSLSSSDDGVSSGSAHCALSFISSDSTIWASFFSARQLDRLVTTVFSSMYLLVGSSSLSGSSLAPAFT
jgi:hypothetical protein